MFNKKNINVKSIAFVINYIPLDNTHVNGVKTLRLYD